MKGISKWRLGAVGMVLCLGISGGLGAEEKKEAPKPYAVGVTTFTNKYVFRGYESSKDSLVIQPALTLGYLGVEVGLWGNLDLKDRYTGSDKANWNETDLTLSYTNEWGPVKVSGGGVYYALDGAEDSLELFVRASGNVLLSPTISVYREILNYPGWYINLGVSHSFPLTQTLTLDLAASVGYQISDTDKIVKYDGALNPTMERYRALHDGLISVGLTIPLGKIFALKPMVGYSLALSTDAKNRIKGTSLSNAENFFLAGVSLTANF